MMPRTDPPAWPSGLDEPAASTISEAAGITGPELLTAWRAVERRYAQAQAGTDEAGQLHAEMRRLMDVYEWTIRGSVARPRDGGPRRGR